MEVIGTPEFNDLVGCPNTFGNIVYMCACVCRYICIYVCVCVCVVIICNVYV